MKVSDVTDLLDRLPAIRRKIRMAETDIADAQAWVRRAMREKAEAEEEYATALAPVYTLLRSPETAPVVVLIQARALPVLP